MKNCSAPIGKSQKLLLKVLSCLWKQFVVCRIPNTKIYFANPTSGNYANMKTELDAIEALIAISALLQTLNVPNTDDAVSQIIAANALGQVAYGYTAAQNTYSNAIANTIQPINIGTDKTVQNLNVNECIETAVQVRPIFVSEVINTQAVITGRTGCPGVSNTGFVMLGINVDITAFPFNTCQCADPCADKKC